MSKSTKIILVIVTLIIIVVTIGITIQLVIQKDKPITLEELIKSGKSTNIESDQLTVTDLDINVTPKDNLSGTYNELAYENQIDYNKITMTLKEGTLTRTKATFIILNNNEETYYWKENYSIQRKENGGWKNLTPINMYYKFPTKGDYIEKGRKIEKEINWSEFYGELENGEYRIVKGGFFYGYFTIK